MDKGIIIYLTLQLIWCGFAMYYMKKEINSKQNNKITHAVFIGINAGSEITEGDGIVIIGDNILNLDKSQSNVLFIGEKVAIGKTLFGKPINMMEVITEHLTKNK
jgi:hypothetical protein